MARLSHAQMEDLLQAISSLYAAASVSSTAVKDALLAAIARLIAVEVVTYDELVAGEGVRLRQFPDSPPVSQVLPVFSACLHTHPIMPAFYEHGAEPSKSSDYATLNQFRETAVYREVYRGFGVEHQMYVYPQGPEFRNVSVTLNRRRRDFTEEEREYLRRLSPHFAQAYRNVCALESSRGQRDLLRAAAVSLRQESVFFDAAGKPETLSGRAARWLRQYFPESPRGGRLPETLLRWIEHQRGEQAVTVDSSRAAEPLVVSQPQGRLAARWYADAAARQMLLLTEEVSLFSPEALVDLGLTPREAEVLRWMAEGKTDYEMGVILGVSEHTAHKHAQNIYGKLGVSSRAMALLRVCELQGRA